jgi:hypothetical protein
MCRYNNDGYCQAIGFKSCISEDQSSCVGQPPAAGSHPACRNESARPGQNDQHRSLRLPFEFSRISNFCTLQLQCHGLCNVDNTAKLSVRRTPKNDTFRYLVLQPGAAHEPLMCSLITARIADTKYHAISYVWSTDLRDQKILCDGRDLMVTVNLFKALQCIRLPDRPLTLWADSICINQEDKLEKGHQISLMGKIYRSAKCVLIYIGSDDDGHAPDVCSLLDEVDETIQSACRETGITWDSCPYPSVDDSLLNDPRWDFLCQLLSQDWFKRG